MDDGASIKYRLFWEIIDVCWDPIGEDVKKNEEMNLIVFSLYFSNSNYTVFSSEFLLRFCIEKWGKNYGGP
jgi:hypothetical protein